MSEMMSTGLAAETCTEVRTPDYDAWRVLAAKRLLNRDTGWLQPTNPLYSRIMVYADGDPRHPEMVPDWHEDLNAVAELERQVLTTYSLRQEYCSALLHATWKEETMCLEYWCLATATATQRFEAVLRTTGVLTGEAG